uniref:rRNA-processing protein FYV7 n=1 Tax=Mycena chlorophos TaxID=658473 RepID=A0ABQ0KZI5_MYCCL|nr:predicted protein [Mycena chlorophos]
MPAEKRKRPPTFQHHPAKQAKKLKQAWIQNAKIKQKWRAEKRKIGAGEEEGEAGDKGEQQRPVREHKPKPPPPERRKHHRASPPTPQLQQPQEPSLRDRAREAYSRLSLHTYKSDPSGRKNRGGQTGRGQPDMKKRMNVLLETIKRDYS